MERSITGPLPSVHALPDGLEVRPVGAEDGWAIWQADHDAFRDHWGGHDPSEANFRRWAESPEFDPSLFVVAYDGDEIAGGVLNAIYPEENEELGIRRGWLDSVFTRRAWRRRGLARSLIVRSLHLLRERGMEIAALGVDADNPSGALGLYESVGFAPTERFTAWRRPLEGP
jgi:ribosomal protein S18 acetylase RimI-like enzyme